MNLSEELHRLESTDVAVSQRFTQHLISVLNANRDPELLSDLIDFRLQRNSKAALRVLTALKDIHSQDFFAKLHDCLLKVQTRLKSLILLAHMLIGQASWLYKTVDSPVFNALLQLLRSADDVVLLSSALHVFCALIPLSPFHISKHLPDLFEGFTRTATLKSVLVKLPRELFLGLDMAVFYFFLQLYALYPCMFLQYLKARFGPTGDIQMYNEHIAPLFRYVQLHPNFITDLPNHEVQRTVWSSKDPHDIATLALSLCTDSHLVQHEPEGVDPLPQKESTVAEGFGPPIDLINHLSCDQSLCGPIEDISVLSPLGNITPPPGTAPHPRSHLSSHSSDSCLSGSNSLQTTPLMNVPGEKRIFSYSPTASVEGSEAASTVHSSNFELPQKNTGLSPMSSGRTSPTKSAGNTPRSFRHIVNDIFRRSNVNAEDKEDFTNISASELEAVIDYNKKESGTTSEAFPSKSLSLKVPEPNRVTPEPVQMVLPTQSINNEPSLAKAEQLAMPMSLPISSKSFSNEDTILKARERLNSLQPRCLEREMRIHSNSFITSYESLATLTSHDDDINPSSLLIHRTVSSDRSCSNGLVGVALSPLSPAASLDQYIQNGNILHIGRVRDIPVTDLPGTDWDHFGGCPHAEELKIKTGLAAILHSQVLFERYQCQQHARRNRRLMSKARTTTKLENEVLALRCRLHQQDELIANLQSDALATPYEPNVTTFTGNGCLLSQNKSLHESNNELMDEVKRLKGTLKQLKENNKSLTKKVGNAESLEKENASLKKKLAEVPHLQNQIDTVLKEQLVIEELYHQQKIAVSALRRENTELQQMKHLNIALTAEKKGMVQNVMLLKQEVCQLKAMLKEKAEDIDAKDMEINQLKRSLEKLQHECNDKLESVEQKYKNVKNVNQHLEEQILQMQGRSSYLQIDPTTQ